MPNETVEARLDRAKQYLAIADSPDAKREGYIKAAEEVAAALEEGATQVFVATNLGRSQSFVSKLVRWRASGFEGATPYLADENATGRAAASHTRSTLRDPERRREVIESLSPEERAAVAREAVRDEDTAEALTEELIESAPDAVRDRVESGLRAHRHGMPVTRRERRERDDEAARRIQPAVAALHGPSAGSEAVLALQSAAEVINEMIEQGSLTEEIVHQIDVALDRVVAVMATARAMAGVES